jgi:hypothetical protein
MLSGFTASISSPTSSGDPPGGRRRRGRSRALRLSASVLSSLHRSHESSGGGALRKDGPASWGSP